MISDTRVKTLPASGGTRVRFHLPKDIAGDQTLLADVRDAIAFEMSSSKVCVTQSRPYRIKLISGDPSLAVCSDDQNAARRVCSALDRLVSKYGLPARLAVPLTLCDSRHLLESLSETLLKVSRAGWTLGAARELVGVAGDLLEHVGADPDIQELGPEDRLQIQLAVMAILFELPTDLRDRTVMNICQHRYWVKFAVSMEMLDAKVVVCIRDMLREARIAQALDPTGLTTEDADQLEFLYEAICRVAPFGF